MRFEWDPEKSERDLRERGFDFGAVAQIFAGFTLERPDKRNDSSHHLSSSEQST